jgi:hypothetical protein
MSSLQQATRLVLPGAGRVLIETFDCRSEDIFDEFCAWVGEALRVEIRPHSEDESVVPRAFEWGGEVFYLGWEDEHGCYVEGTEAQRGLIDKMQRILTWGE